MPRRPEDKTDDVRAETDGLAGISAKAVGSFLAFASGDALGWPQEMPANRAAGRPDIAFRDWTRRTGGRFQQHSEPIRAGEYSDDTQLLIAVARARLTTNYWVERLAFHELPLFPLYERGAGRATLRACRSWRHGRGPWLLSDEKDREEYFAAGANGVAMRSLPHAFWHHRAASPHELAADVYADGLLTHGHPRALVGGILYATAAWILLRRRETLGFGELFETLSRAEFAWCDMPGVQPRFDGLREVVDRVQAEWQRTTVEVREMLLLARQGLEQGALGDDREVLERLGCFGKAKGSGTVTAVAAIYLASRYAAQPTSGVIAAAFATGGDTDTLAAMTGGLLGALVGRTWMPTEWLEVQDSPFLTETALRLVDRDIDPEEWQHLGETDIERLAVRIQAAESSEPIPELRGRVVETAYLSSKERQVARLITVSSEHGQTFRVKRILPKTERIEMLPVNSRPKLRNARRIVVKFRGIQMVVRDLKRSARFYEDLLGLKGALTRRGVYVVDNRLELIDAHEARALDIEPHGPGPVITLDAGDVYGLADRLEGFGVKDVRVHGDAADYVWVRFRDPDGNLIEVREAGSKG